MLKTAKQQVTVIACATALAGFSVWSLVAYTDPFSSSRVTFFFFYLSLFLLSLGLFTLLGLLIRHWLPQRIFVINLAASFRQAILLATVITISFILLSQRLLFWWVELSLILFFLSIEVFLNLKI